MPVATATAPYRECFKVKSDFYARFRVSLSLARPQLLNIKRYIQGRSVQEGALRSYLVALYAFSVRHTFLGENA